MAVLLKNELGGFGTGRNHSSSRMRDGHDTCLVSPLLFIAYPLSLAMSFIDESRHPAMICDLLPRLHPERQQALV